MRFVASSVVQYSYELSFGDCAAPCTYFIIFFVIFEGFGVGGWKHYNLTPIKQGKDINNLGSPYKFFPKGLVYSDPTAH